MSNTINDLLLSSSPPALLCSSLPPSSLESPRNHWPTYDSNSEISPQTPSRVQPQGNTSPNLYSPLQPQETHNVRRSSRLMSKRNTLVNSTCAPSPGPPPASIHPLASLLPSKAVSQGRIMGEVLSHQIPRATSVHIRSGDFEQTITLTVVSL